MVSYFREKQRGSQNKRTALELLRRLYTDVQLSTTQASDVAVTSLPHQAIRGVICLLICFIIVLLLRKRSSAIVQRYKRKTYIKNEKRWRAQDLQPQGVR